MPRLINFIKQLLSSGDEVSSKRVSAFIALLVMIAAAIVAIISAPAHVLPQFMFDGFLIFAGSGLGLTVIEKIFTRKTPPSDSTPE